jgi:hypothetical protein
LYMIKIKRCYVVHKPNENFVSLYNVGNGLYRVFTTAKRALSFQQKRVFIQEILFSFFKRGTLAQQKGHFIHFQKKWGHMPAFLPAPVPLECLDHLIVFKNSNYICQNNGYKCIL